MTDNAPISYPSHFVAKTVKSSPNYCLQYSKAFDADPNSKPQEDTKGLIFRANKDYARNRAYSRGEQSENQYKERIGLKKENGKFVTSFRNLNFAILPVAPKIKNVLVNKVLNQPYKINVKAVDSTSINERMSEKNSLLEYVISQEEIQRFEMLTKLGLEKPVGPGELPPTSRYEIEPWMDMHPKNQMSMEVKDFITWSLYYNDWNQLKREIVTDIVEVGVGGTRQYIDEKGFPRIRRLIPERCILNRCIYPDFRDITRFGEYYQITISALRRITKGKLIGKNGETGEGVYAQLAKSLPGNQNKYDGTSTSLWNSTGSYYAYDEENITILDSLWLSDDPEVSVKYNNGSSNLRVKQESFDYVPFKGDMSINEGRGMSDEQYKAHNNGTKSIYRETVTNVYKCSWVVGTDFVFDCGLLDNMLRSVSMTGQTQLPVALTTTDFQSTFGNIETALDQVQLHYLQFQSHSAASKPPGIAIEKLALAKVGGKSGRGGLKWDPRENLMMYAEIGSLIYDGYDAHGSPLNHLPFMELKNGLSPGALEHWSMIIQIIEMIRNQLGLNVLTEGQTPPERLGKSVAQLSYGASENALSHINEAYKKIYERTCRQVVGLMQGAIGKISQPGMTEALGSETYKFFKLNSQVGMREMGIMIEEGADEQVKTRISLILDQAIVAGDISGEDAIMVEQEDNYYKAVQMIRKLKKERQASTRQHELAVIEKQGEENTKTAVALEQEKKKSMDEQAERDHIRVMAESNARMHEQAEKFLQDVAITKLKENTSLEESEKEFILGVMKFNNDYKIAKLNAATKARKAA